MLEEAQPQHGHGTGTGTGTGTLQHIAQAHSTGQNAVRDAADRGALTSHTTHPLSQCPTQGQ